MKKFFVLPVLFSLAVSPLLATATTTASTTLATTSTTTQATSSLDTASSSQASSTLKAASEALSQDPLVVPAETPDSSNNIFETRPADRYNFFNSFAYFVQRAAELGIPLETIALTLLLPFIATMVAFVRNIIGLPSLDMLAIITFTIALLASNLLVGGFLLGVIIMSSIGARLLFKRIRIMQLPKISLSMFFVSVTVLLSLFLAASTGYIQTETISIVPILLLIILSERIVRLQFESSPRQMFVTVATTLVLGIIGYVLLLSTTVRTSILLYPELIFLLIPINIAVGRYFGLRLVELWRFQAASAK